MTHGSRIMTSPARCGAMLRDRGPRQRMGSRDSRRFVMSRIVRAWPKTRTPGSQALLFLMAGCASLTGPIAPVVCRPPIATAPRPVIVEVPEVYELANIILALTNYRSLAAHTVLGGPYLMEVRTHFDSMRDHPLIAALNTRLTSSGSWNYDVYYGFRENSFVYSFGPTGLVHSPTYARAWGGTDVFNQETKRVADFANRSAFRAFYATGARCMRIRSAVTRTSCQSTGCGCGSKRASPNATIDIVSCSPRSSTGRTARSATRAAACAKRSCSSPDRTLCLTRSTRAFAPRSSNGWYLPKSTTTTSIPRPIGTRDWSGSSSKTWVSGTATPIATARRPPPSTST